MSRRKQEKWTSYGGKRTQVSLRRRETFNHSKTPAIGIQGVTRQVWHEAVKQMSLGSVGTLERSL